MIAVGARAVGRPAAEPERGQGERSAPQSVSMCPASASSASEPEMTPPAISTNMKPAVSSRTQKTRRSLSVVTAGAPWA